MKFCLKDMRVMQNLSQNQLARLCEMSVTNVQRYEQGRSRNIPFQTLELFCNVLKCKPGDLMVLDSENTN